MTPEATRLTERDLTLLLALAEHRVAVVAQAARWLGVSERTAGARVRRLRDAGLIESGRLFDRGSPMLRITGPGLRRIGSSLGRPGQKLDEYRHDVGVAWLWTLAREGRFGPMETVISERSMRSADLRAEREGVPVGTGAAHAAGSAGDPARFALAGRLTGTGERELHYPDLWLRSCDGRHIAVELELTAKGRRRLDRVMDAYRWDPRSAAVLYLVADAAGAEKIRAAAERAGISQRVYIRRLAPGGVAGVPGFGAAASVGRVAPRRAATTRPAEHVATADLGR